MMGTESKNNPGTIFGDVHEILMSNLEQGKCPLAQRDLVIPYSLRRISPDVLFEMERWLLSVRPSV